MGAESKLTAFTIALDKLDKIGNEGVLNELKANDFSPEALQKLQMLLELKGSALEQLNTLQEVLADEAEGQEGIKELRFVLKQMESTTLKSSSLQFDLSLARGLHYYTGMIVEVSAPETVTIGSIGGGGRYDDLTGTFGMKDTSGIGISFGFERIYLVLEELGLFPEILVKSTQVLFANFGDEAASVAYSYIKKLRDLNIPCELYPTETKLKKQLTYANDKKIAQVVLIGSEELKQNSFVLKNMDTGEQASHALSTLVSMVS